MLETSHAKKFNKGGLHNFAQLSEIFVRTITTGQGSMKVHTAVNVLNAAKRVDTTRRGGGGGYRGLG